MRQIKYSMSISILVLLILIVFLFAGCSFLKAVLPDTNVGTTTTNTNTESTTGSNEETETTSNPGDNSNTGVNAPPDLGGVTEFVEQEVLVKIKPGADVEKIVSEIGGTIIETLPQISVIRIQLGPQVSVAEAIQILEKLEEVEYAEANGVCYMDVVPNDADYADRQWAPQLTGAESAWAVTTGDAGVTIAITDTGVDGTHPDLGGKVIAGWDTFNDIPISAGANSAVYYHGTHCAGIAAAVGNNSQGMAGVAWGSKIMPIKMCKDVSNYTASWSDMAQAFIWAADNGADIISCSFGGKGYSQTMKDATDYAVIDMGCAMFASMGNSSVNEFKYPAGYQSVIAVGATDAHDEIASFSTTGDHMSVCAPGVEIYSTMPEGGYNYLSGTSMACPFAAGAAALVLSIYPGMSPEEVKSQLEETAVDLGSTGFDSTYGYGRVDLAAAVGAPESNKYGVVDVLVTDSLSHPISGASVILWQEGTVISTTNSNEGGHAKFEYIQAGEYGISVSFEDYSSSLTANNPVTVIAGQSVSKNISFAEAKISEVEAFTITRQGTNMEMFQAKMDKLVEEELIPDSYHLNEVSPITKGVVEHMIHVDWHFYPDATGYRIYRSVNGVAYTLILDWEAPSGYNWYGMSDNDVSPGSTYSYYVTAYGSGWETDPSEIVTRDVWLPPCSLISPLDGAIITAPNPVFEWFSVGVSTFPFGSIYEGDSDLWVYDDTDGEQVWWRIFYDNMSVSTITYNDDGQAAPLVSGHAYLWESCGYGYNENGHLIATSWSENWDFVYSGGEPAGITDVGAVAQTYYSSYSPEMSSNYLNELEESRPGQGYFFNEAAPLEVDGIGNSISVTWKAYCETTGYGYKVYRNVDGGGYEIVFSQEAPTGYDWYGWVDNEAGPGSGTYSYYITAYGDVWETDLSQIVTIDTWLPACSLVSPADESTIDIPEPTFTWDPGITDFPYYSLLSGNTCMLVYDFTTNDFTWIFCTGDPNVSTATYDQDGEALPLVNGHNYTWHCWTSGYDESWNRIAVSESEHWYFDYSGD